MRALLMVLASTVALAGSVTCGAHDLATPGEGIEHGEPIYSDELSLWLKGRFSEAEIERFHRGDLKIESYSCGCYDKPNKHFPYLIVLLKTPRGDLVARPESREGAASFTALAVRYGTRYCDLETAENCFGSFPDVCEFTDFRYGPYLAAYFPTCKSDEPDPS